MCNSFKVIGTNLDYTGLLNFNPFSTENYFPRIAMKFYDINNQEIE